MERKIGEILLYRYEDNADVNGSLNIMIKAIPNAFDNQAKRNGIEAGNRPSVLNVYSGEKELTTLKSFL